MIEYKASGELLAAIPTKRLRDRTQGHFILVKLNTHKPMWVTSLYFSPDKEWVAGTYYETEELAIRNFCLKLLNEPI